MPTLPERLLTLFATFHIRREKSLADLEPLYASGVRFVDPLVDIEGRDAYMRLMRHLLKRFPEIRFDEPALVGAEPHFMLSWTMRARMRVGPEVVAPGVSEFKSENGLVVFQRDHWDVLSSTAESVPGLGAVYRRITSKVYG